jgi:septum formation protein
MSGLWKAKEPLLLASASRTRLSLLRAALIPVETKPPMVDERSIEAGLQRRGVEADQIALALASAKGEQVSCEHPDRLVLAADQTLALGREQLHKPTSLGEARLQLQTLSGGSHALHAAVVCFSNGQRVFAHVASALLTMRILQPAFIDKYLAAAGESALQSVGGYQLEGLGIHLFERIEGDHSTILGLPMMPLLAYFRSVGMVVA